MLAPLVGSTTISLARAFDRSIPFADNVDAQIFFVARLPRVLAGACVGATLAAAGVVLQAMLRNPLATPFTLGVSAGASLGAMLAILFGASLAVGPLSAVPLASLAGAAVASAIVYRLATMQGRAMSTSVLLLAGVTLNSFFSALIMFVQYIADFAQVYRATRWLMGDLDVGSFQPIVAALPLLLIAFALFALLPSSLNLLSVGADVAATRGVDVARAQRLAFLSASLATAAAVSLAGPDRLHRHRRSAPRAADGGRRPPHRAARVGALRRGISRRVRACRAHGPGADRGAGRRRHGDAWRSVLPMAARTERVTLVILAVTESWCRRKNESAPCTVLRGA